MKSGRPEHTMADIDFVHPLPEVTVEAQKKCLTPGCSSTAGAPNTYRGLCMRCYSSAKRLVEAGTTTWESLETSGLVLPKDDAFLKAFKDRAKLTETDL